MAAADLSGGGRVFGIAELAEAILLQLPPRDVLLGQRVCMQWKAVFESSTRLQQALFLRPASEDRVSLHGGALDGKWARSSEAPATTVFQHPLLSMRANPDQRTREAARRPGASWRRMLLASTPLDEVHFYYLAPHLGQHGRTWGGKGHAVIRARGQGVTLGDLAEHCGEASFQFDCWMIMGDSTWQHVPWATASASRILERLKGVEGDGPPTSACHTAKKVVWSWKAEKRMPCGQDGRLVTVVDLAFCTADSTTWHLPVHMCARWSPRWRARTEVWTPVCADKRCRHTVPDGHKRREWRLSGGTAAAAAKSGLGRPCRL